MLIAYLLILLGLFFIIYGVVGIVRKRITVGRIKLINLTKKPAITWGIIYIILGIILTTTGIKLLQ